VPDQPDHGQRDRAADHVACGRIGAEVGDGDLGGERCRRRQCADVLGGLVGQPAPAWRSALDEGVEEVGRHLLADLDLELAEGPAGPAPFGTDTASSTTPAMSRPSASCISVRRRIVVMCTVSLERVPRIEPTHELDRVGRWSVAVPVEHDLGRTRNGASRSAGSLTVQPSAGAVTEDWRPAREPEVRRVVVRRLVALGRRLAHDRTDEP
jgi:hypothetical protein